MRNEIANKTFAYDEDGSSPDEHPPAHFGKLGNSKPRVLRSGFALGLYNKAKGGGD